MFEAKALELVARRVSAASGDMRAAISACDTAASKLKRNAMAPSALFENNQSASHPMRLITVAQVADALKACGSGASAQASTQVAAIQELPAQQQLLLCTLAIARGTVAHAAAAGSPAQCTPTAQLSQQPLSVQFKTTSGLGRFDMSGVPRALPKTPQTQMKAGPGFGLGSTLGASPSANRAFPRADDEMLVTPDTAPATPKTAAGHGRAAASPSAQKSDLPMQTVYNRYKAAAKEAGFAALDMSQLQAMAHALQESGLLQSRRAVGTKSAASKRLSLAVSTDDVKHALHENRMLQALVTQLP